MLDQSVPANTVKSNGNQVTPSTPPVSGELNLLYSQVYKELSRIAHGRFSGATPTLDTIAVVNEAYVRLANYAVGEWQGVQHVRRVACRAMRQIVCNYLRDKKSLKRGGDQHPITLNESLVSGRISDFSDVLDLNQALEILYTLNPRQAEVVELRFFGGYEIEEVAETLEVGSATVKRDWFSARLFLQRYLNEQQKGAETVC